MWLSPIKKFISTESFGPANIEFLQLGDVRYGIINPYGHYCCNVNGEIYLMDFSNRDNFNAFCFKRNMVGDDDDYDDTICTRIRVGMDLEFFDNIFQKYKRNITKIVIYREPDYVPVLQLLNLCIKRGVFIIN